MPLFYYFKVNLTIHLAFLYLQSLKKGPSCHKSNLLFIGLMMISSWLLARPYQLNLLFGLMSIDLLDCMERLALIMGRMLVDTLS
jgi:hypothetical protein